MREPARLKKSESLEIRIPHPTKQAFMDRCRREGLSASEALRRFIEQQIDETDARPRRADRKRLRLAAGVVIAAAMGAVALPSLARPSERDAFVQLDADGDGQLSPAELFRGADVEVKVRLAGSRLSLSEDRQAATAVRQVAVDRAFRRLDRNRDGRIDFAEFAGGDGRA